MKRDAGRELDAGPHPVRKPHVEPRVPARRPGSRPPPVPLEGRGGCARRHVALPEQAPCRPGAALASLRETLRRRGVAAPHPGARRELGERGGHEPAVNARTTARLRGARRVWQEHPDRAPRPRAARGRARRASLTREPTDGPCGRRIREMARAGEPVARRGGAALVRGGPARARGAGPGAGPRRGPDRADRSLLPLDGRLPGRPRPRLAPDSRGQRGRVPAARPGAAARDRAGGRPGAGARPRRSARARSSSTGISSSAWPRSSAPWSDPTSSASPRREPPRRSTPRCAPASRLGWGCSSPLRAAGPTGTFVKCSNLPRWEAGASTACRLRKIEHSDNVPAQSKSSGARARPVWLMGCWATSSGVPWATISPPFSPPSGPRSMT